MAGRPQNSPKGLFIKRQIGVTDSTGNVTMLTANSSGVILDKGIRLSSKANAQLTGDTTGVVVLGGLKINSVMRIQANSTGLILTSRLTKPATRSSSKLALLTNSTGQNSLLVNTTGTTWKFLNVTSIIPQ